MKLSVREELRGNRLSFIRAVILSSSGVPKLLVLDIPLGNGMVLFSGVEGGTRPWRSNKELISACVMRRLVGLCFTVAALKSSDGRALRTTSC